MAYIFNGTSDYFSIASPPFRGGTALTASIWVNLSGITEGKCFGIWDDGGAQQEWLITTTAGILTVAVHDNFGSQYQVITGGLFSLNTWANLIIRFIQNSILEGFVNGISIGTTPTGIMQTFSSPMTIGAGLNGGSANNFVTGNLCEAGLWDINLDNNEIKALSKGYSPSLIRPTSLKFYTPLLRDIMDLKGKTITKVGSPLPSNHTRIYGAQ